MYKKMVNFGPGGMKCPCCGPAPGKVRKATLRRAKRGPLAAAARNEIREGLAEWDADAPQPTQPESRADRDRRNWLRQQAALEGALSERELDEAEAFDTILP